MTTCRKQHTWRQSLCSLRFPYQVFREQFSRANRRKSRRGSGSAHNRLDRRKRPNQHAPGSPTSLGSPTSPGSHNSRSPRAARKRSSRSRPVDRKRVSRSPPAGPRRHNPLRPVDPRRVHRSSRSPSRNRARLSNPDPQPLFFAGAVRALHSPARCGIRRCARRPSAGLRCRS